MRILSIDVSFLPISWICAIFDSRIAFTYFSQLDAEMQKPHLLKPGPLDDDEIDI